MPSVDTYTSLLVVAVEGRPLPATAASVLVSGKVTDAANLPDSFELEFTDEAGTVLADAGFAIGKKVVLSVSENGPQGPQRLIDGEVTAIDCEDVAGSLRTRVRGFDRSHRLFRGRRVAAYVDKTTADIVREVARKAGVPVKTIDVAGAVSKHVTQDNVSDWVFLKRLADAAGCTFSVVEDGLVFSLPTQATEAPSGAQSARDDPVVLEHGMNVLWLSATVTAASQVPGVEVRGWDPVAKQAVVASAKPTTRVVELPTLKPDGVAKTFGSPTYVATTGDGQQRSQDSQAKAVAERIAGGFAEIEARLLGNSKMHSGTAVKLKGYGAPFTGRYTVTEAQHEFIAGGYTTTVIISNASDRSLYGITSGGGAGVSGSADEAARMQGVVSALVSDIDDPEGRGRVKLTFPYLSDDYVSGWARTVQPGAGAKRGSVVLPEVGDEVLVAFEGDRFDRPFVVGGLYNGKDEPEIGWGDAVKNGAVVRRAFTSRTGMEVVFTEESGTESLTLSTNGKAQRVTLTQTADKGIEIISEGPVTVTAKQNATVTSEQDATVTADKGTISLSGSSVKIKAKGEVSVEGATLKLKGTGSTEVEGATLALKAQGTAELSSSGITTVKGSLVKIN